MVRVTVRSRVKARVRFRVRENGILDGNQLFGPHKDSNTKLSMCETEQV